MKRLLPQLRTFRLLRLLVFFHGMAIAILAALHYSQGSKLWNARLYLEIGTEYVFPARGASLLLPWNLLPHDVAWLALDALVFGTLTICLTYRIVGDELRGEIAGREQAAADKLREAKEQSTAADCRIREAQAWEQRLKVIESRLAAREFEVVNREAEAQAHVEGKDAEVKKMSGALTRLKKEVKQLRGPLSDKQEKE